MRKLVALALIGCLQSAAAALEPPRTLVAFAITFTPHPLVPLAAALKSCGPPPARLDVSWKGAVRFAPEPASIDVSEADAHALAAATDELAIRLEGFVLDLHTRHQIERHVGCLAEAMQGLVTDEQTHVLFGRTAFRSKRLDTWRGDEPGLESRVTVVQVPTSTGVESSTSGLDRLGAKDLVLREHPRSRSEAVASLLQAGAKGMLRQPSRRELTFGREHVKLIDGMNPFDGPLELDIHDARRLDVVLTAFLGRKPDASPR